MKFSERRTFASDRRRVGQSHHAHDRRVEAAVGFRPREHDVLSVRGDLASVEVAAHPHQSPASCCHHRVGHPDLRPAVPGLLAHGSRELTALHFLLIRRTIGVDDALGIRKPRRRAVLKLSDWACFSGFRRSCARSSSFAEGIAGADEPFSIRRPEQLLKDPLSVELSYDLLCGQVADFDSRLW